MNKNVIDCSLPIETQVSILELTTEETGLLAEAVQQAKERQAREILNTVVAMTVERCVIAGVAFPQDWKDFVISLRAIVNGGEDEIPETPAYPEGS